MKVILLLFICLIFTSSTVQDEGEEIYKFVLLVRLKTGENQIKAALETGNKDHAKQMKLENRGMNMHIMKAFKKYFGHQVFFFYSSDYSKVKKKEFKGIFLNDELERDSTIQPQIDDFFVSYWGNSPNLGISVIALLDSAQNDTEIWVRTFGITPHNLQRIDPQVKNFKEKVQNKLPKYLKKKGRL